MQLIDRYIHEIGRYLPRKNRLDIQNELRSLLNDSLEAKVKAEPTDDDVVALLKEFGPPEKVAASYRPQSFYLIGPEFFPIFRTVVGIALLVTLIVHLVLSGLVLFTSSDFLKALDVLSGFFGASLSALGAIVVVFYILQLFDVRLKEFEEPWDPRQLPDVPEKDILQRGGLVVNMSFSLLFLVGLLVFPQYIGVVVTPGTPVLTDPVILRNIPLIVVAILLGLAVNLVLFWRRRWERSTRLAKIGSNLFSLVVLGVLIAGHAEWYAQHTVGNFFGVLSNLPVDLLTESELTLTLAMYFVQWGLVIALIVIAVETLKLAWNVVRQQLPVDITPQV